MRLKKHPVLKIQDKQNIPFKFNDQIYHGKEGETIAVSLWSEGVKVLRKSERSKTSRGIYCGIGNCYDCRVHIKGRGLVRSCLTPVEPGIEVVSEREVKKNDL